jgi:ABC-type lipoprotein export system ATPase subunit
MKITELQLHNFKFFTDTDNILKIDSKNVLIWGENGSGKSSIYWAIYTLLQCSYKDNAGIDAYFTENHVKNLLNIHKPAGDDAFVQMNLDNGSSYKIALADYSVKDDSDIQISAISSDFINYQVLASFLNFYHRDDPVLFEMFEEEIFRYLQFSPSAPYTFSFFNDAWEELKKPLVKSKIGRTNKYPSPQSTIYINKNNLKNTFNIQLATLLGIVTTKANQILQDPNGFNLDIEIELAYREYDFGVSNRNSEYQETMPEIFLKIRRYDGLVDVVKKPHSFLNEAKKTAIGLAIRLGILERRLLANKLNLLALDDLLISLDMSNREVVLKLLFNEYQKDYQLLIFTHDKQFFNIAKHKIEHSTFKDEWYFWEFYVNEKDPAIPKPRFFATKSQLATMPLII